MACGLILIAAVDVPFQLWDSKQKLMMTKQEVKDEYKDSEGKPEVKSKIRQLQRQMAERRMMQQVPEADVVITNPTHFAVALKYDPAKGNAPVMLAKGGDFLALKIREIAQEHKVTLLESPALARAVYYSTEVDQEIPAGLYLAVAQVLGLRLPAQAVPCRQGQAPGAATGSADSAGSAPRRVAIVVRRLALTALACRLHLLEGRMALPLPWYCT